MMSYRSVVQPTSSQTNTTSTNVRRNNNRNLLPPPPPPPPAFSFSSAAAGALGSVLPVLTAVISGPYPVTASAEVLADNYYSLPPWPLSDLYGTSPFSSGGGMVNQPYGTSLFSSGGGMLQQPYGTSACSSGGGMMKQPYGTSAFTAGGRTMKQPYGASPFTAGERMMKQPAFGMMQQPAYGASSYNKEAEYGQQDPCYFKEGEDALYIVMDMPGVEKDGLKVFIEGDILRVKGVRKWESEFENQAGNHPVRYGADFSLTPIYDFKVAEIKAEMKDGVLKVTVPKVKDAERTDVMHILIN